MADLPDTIELRIRRSEAETAKKFADCLGEMRASFARLDNRLDRLEGRLDRIGDRLGHLGGRMGQIENSLANINTTVVGTGIAVVAATIAGMAFGQTWFGIQATTRDIVKSAVSEYIQQHPAAQP